MWGTAEYQLQKDKLWDKIKTYSGWENDLVADIKVEKTDVYGYYVVKSGDSLSKISKDVYDNAGLYKKIYEANKATIGDNPEPDQAGPEAHDPEPLKPAGSGGRLRSPPGFRCPCRPLSVVRLVLDSSLFVRRSH